MSREPLARTAPRAAALLSKTRNQSTFPSTKWRKLHRGPRSLLLLLVPVTGRVDSSSCAGATSKIVTPKRAHNGKNGKADGSKAFKTFALRKSSPRGWKISHRIGRHVGEPRGLQGLARGRQDARARPSAGARSTPKTGTKGEFAGGSRAWPGSTRRRYCHRSVTCRSGLINGSDGVESGKPGAPGLRPGGAGGRVKWRGCSGKQGGAL